MQAWLENVYSCPQNRVWGDLTPKSTSVCRNIIWRTYC